MNDRPNVHRLRRGAAAVLFAFGLAVGTAVGAGAVPADGPGPDTSGTSSTVWPSEVKAGDRLDVFNGDTRWEVTVLALSEKRGPASEARLLYEETPDSIAAREAEQMRRKFEVEPSADIHGRPTKRDRRQMDRFGR